MLKLLRPHQSAVIIIAILAILGGCTSTKPNTSKPSGSIPAKPSLSKIEVSGDAREVVMVALGLLDTGYQFGGNNPEAGLDCSGLVRYVYQNALNVLLPRTAAEMAQAARPVSRQQLQAGDLVFFNTLGTPFSHVGIYLGDGQFIHAPSSKGRVRIESLDKAYFATRFEGGRSLFATR
ncbi:C40 family peptidase [Chitinibacter sp. ZOR0017]|uniref:C40 family peptidase n=1 Tax=Chitinibacter sp. ZOR0017 TaxID=1339254 RepID=UPI000646ED45|nr:C40 family peptidase [Chitinibacter sp. ZOR0017]